jgi:hypothetical protein
LEATLAISDSGRDEMTVTGKTGYRTAYGDRRETNNPFYASLKPWNREASDMWEFPGFLTFWGWRL